MRPLASELPSQPGHIEIRTQDFYDAVQRTWLCLVSLRGMHCLAVHDTLQATFAHEALHCTARHIAAFPA